MELTVSIVVTLVGAVVYFVSTNGKLAELARIAFFVGLMWFVYRVSGHAVHF